MRYKTQALIALAAGTLLTLSVVPVLGARAVSPEESTCYANQIVSLQNRVTSIEIAVAKFIDDQSNTVQNYKIAELERKVAGMQKQITILHSKKADKWTVEKLTKEEKAYIEKSMGTDK